jgi:hypothetical protein
MNLTYWGKKGRTDRTQHSAVTATDKLLVGRSSVLLKQRPAPHQSAKLSLLVLLLVVAGVMAATAVTGRRYTRGCLGADVQCGGYRGVIAARVEGVDKRRRRGV